LTDFFCWAPFIVISALHYYLIVDASSWYATFSILILPINSVINPVLYDPYLGILFHKSLYSFKKFLLRYKSTATNTMGAPSERNTVIASHGSVNCQTGFLTDRTIIDRRIAASQKPSPILLPTAERHALRMMRRKGVAATQTEDGKIIFQNDELHLVAKATIGPET
jgi:hypothetical protein